MCGVGAEQAVASSWPAAREVEQLLVDGQRHQRSRRWLTTSFAVDSSRTKLQSGGPHGLGRAVVNQGTGSAPAEALT